MIIKGVIVHGDVDPAGDQFDVAGVNWIRYLAEGWVSTDCTVAPRVEDIVGHPNSIEKVNEELVMEATVTDPKTVRAIRSGASMGFAIAGVIEEKEEMEDGTTVIRKCKLRSVALMPVGELSDPRTLVTVVKPSQIGR